MTPKEQAAQQALDALEVHQPDPEQQMVTEAIIALQEALAAQVEQEPVAIVEVNQMGIPEITWDKFDEYAAGRYELYAAPVRTKDLTDGEIEKAIVHRTVNWLTNARAVIAAYKEKNK